MGPSRASGVEKNIASLYGEPELPRNAGLLHVTALWQDPARASLVTMNIGADSPKSARDFFALQLSRVRADAIVITGKILREEPELRYTLVGEHADGLLAWRQEVMGRSEPPVLAVLTSGRSLDLAHPVFDGWARPLIYTSSERAGQLAPLATHRGIGLMHDASPSVATLVTRLRREHGAATCTLEVGPRTSRALYGATAEQCQVDELMLSVFAGHGVPDSVIGGELLPESELAQRLPHTSSPCRVDEASGPWRFSRRWR